MNQLMLQDGVHDLEIGEIQHFSSYVKCMQDFIPLFVGQ
ncbi:hypothetical protein BG08_3433 [Bacillus thuringiensis serovar kurstaki]|uniref:Uncharacterized protein n=1 Tax=Bacillus cereus ISP2954 TaxID=1053215 RepID=A0A9W5QHR3_BACCE|nr:hypothetical protein HD73_2623 [Bacillus thuringiensis serovar kurstaki str. HD73]AHZ51262.1 hypothetical protein YBT1520_12840 [Bacillus thuringiensis serovar kurstaki str. YBT-1520]AIE33675.1 hypothetical protein BTK_13010 [Bacillus thuringiensis serovar kurstaki str. HD-1]AJK42578.1 hypothetical protein BG08_3433 [Bacillus thuringiensis serovar kurstaki]ARO60083.1 Uncharacterized protein B5E38_2554 [Bacillus cereus]EEM53538.1 hypothetical protein bthur0006_21140 [Bacillus thuringiensis s